MNSLKAIKLGDLIKERLDQVQQMQKAEQALQALLEKKLTERESGLSQAPEDTSTKPEAFGSWS